MVDVLKELNPNNTSSLTLDTVTNLEFVAKTYQEFASNEIKNEIHRLESRVLRDDFSGASHVVIGGRPNGKFGETVILHTLAFGNALKPITIGRALFFQRAIANAGIRDERGNQIPLVAFAAPSLQSTFRMSSKRRRLKDSAESVGFGDIARAQLSLARARGVGRAIMMGVSMGGDVAMSAACIAGNHNIDTLGVAAADPARVKSRGVVRLVRDMQAEGKSFYEMADENPDPLREIARQTGLLSFLLGVGRHPVVNSRIVKELTNESFLHEAANAQTAFPDIAITIGSGTKSLICPAHEVDKTLQMVPQPPSAKGIHHVRMNEGNHAWPEHPTFGSLFAAYAVARALT